MIRSLLTLVICLTAFTLHAEDKDDGKRHMLWGIVGLAIIFGARTILSILVESVGL